MMGNRLDYVDIAKGIGIVLVVCSHTDALELMWLFMGMFVPVFYFCSGYTFSQKGPLKELMAKRFRKLMAAYVFFNVLMFAAFMHFSWREIGGMLYSRYCLYPLDVSPNVKFLTSGNYPMWFLTSMIVTYLLFYLLVYYERFRLPLIAGYAALTLAFTFCPILLPWSIDTAFLTALFMYAGMLARRYEVMKAGWWQVALVAFVYVGGHLVAGDINLSVRMYGTSVVLYFVLGVTGSCLALWVSRGMEHTLVGNFFKSMGQHSLTIFCVQIFFIVVAKDAWAFLLPDVPLDYWAGVLEVIFALLGGWAVSVVLHKSQYLRRVIF